MAEKQRIDVEKLLHWAYRDELSKRHTSSAEGIWDRIEQAGRLLVLDNGDGGGAQRYACFGLPDPDAERIEAAVSALPNVAVDWHESAIDILGHIAPLMRGRDYVLVGSLRTAALVTMHATMGTRPDWREADPRPCHVPTERGRPGPTIVGECLGRNLYRSGSYCPLRWEPSPVTIAQARADYAAWHAGLCTLVHMLDLGRWAPVAPAAPAMPWRDGDQAAPVHRVGPAAGAVLPLHWPRPVAGPTGATRPGRAAGKGRSVLSD
ncbi:hypothetical protein [Rhodoplanes serenus]|uniref:hypothetical protein n=1 Tax=Rhodoplanes serenus TaxID=200615 RepID=UPI000DAF41C7|nr:hypothetical protein [Rhodoplanes serenus]RAI33723.1 hypothetical protein CH340_11275 [Rhodoplanes serenus]